MLMKRTLSILTVIAMMLACLPVSASADIPSIGIGGGMNGSLSPDRNVEILVSADKGGQVQFMLTLSDGEAAPWVSLGGGVSLNGPDGNGTYTFGRHFDAGDSFILSLSADRETGYSLATRMTKEDVVEETAEEPAAEPAQEEAAEEPAAEPVQEEAAEEPATEPAQEEIAEEPAAEPEQAEVTEEPAAEPEQAEAAEEPAEEPAQEETAEEPAEEPVQEEAAEEPAEEPAQEEAAEEPAAEPAQEEAAEEPVEEPAQKEAAEEPAAEPAQEEAAEEPAAEAEAEEAGEAADPEPEEETPVFEISGDVLKKYNGEDETVTIPDGIRVIGTRAFAGNKYITQVILPATVEIIKNYAFEDCSGLETIVKGPESSLRTIGIGAFQNAARLDASFAEDVTNIVSNAFELTEAEAEEAQAVPAEEPVQEDAAETVSPDDCSVKISVRWDTDDPQIGDVAHFDSVLTGYESLPYTLQWQISRDNETWTDYPGATGPQLDVVLTEELDGVLFRLSVNVESKQEEE